jgi:PAS domain S-box-containing protein/putative nucleotidyltransferase with HDIG domain
VRGTGRFGGDYIVKDLNEAGLAIEGKRKEEVIGRSLKDLRPDVDEYGLVDVFWRVWRTGDPEHFKAEVTMDGRAASWFDNYVFRLDTGEIVAIYNDMTAKKRGDEALRASEAEMHAVFDLAGIPMLVMDTRAGFKRWNRAFQKALGYPAEELQGMTMRDVTPPGERPEMLRRLSVALAGEGSSYRVERRMVAKDGGLPWFDLSVTPVIGVAGDVVALIAAGTDITEARSAKNALVAREEQVRAALGETVAAMGAIVALRDPYTAGHELRVAALVEAIATDMGLAPEAVAGLRHAASVHDVGKVAVPAEIMTMPRRLSEWEYSLVQTHVEVGHEVLASIGFEQPVAEMVLQHHERLDGSGYPRGLRDSEIMPAARILAVADVVEAMASYRPYRSALGVGAALDEIQKGAGSLYDERVVASCLRVVRDGIVDLSEPEA